MRATLLQSIPYHLMLSLLRYLVEYVTLMLNFEPNSTREDPTSRYERFRDLKCLDCRVGVSLGHLELKAGRGMDPFVDAQRWSYGTHHVTEWYSSLSFIIHLPQHQQQTVWRNLSMKKIIISSIWMTSNNLTIILPIQVPTAAETFPTSIVNGMQPNRWLMNTH